MMMDAPLLVIKDAVYWDKAAQQNRKTGNNNKQPDFIFSYTQKSSG